VLYATRLSSVQQPPAGRPSNAEQPAAAKLPLVQSAAGPRGAGSAQAVATLLPCGPALSLAQQSEQAYRRVRPQLTACQPGSQLRSMRLCRRVRQGHRVAGNAQAAAALVLHGIVLSPAQQSEQVSGGTEQLPTGQ